MTFANHGCNGNYNIFGSLEPLQYPGYHNHTEQTVTLSDFQTYSPIFNPYFDRHVRRLECKFVEVFKDINPGDEIFSNYLFMTTSSPELFFEEAEVLKRICSGDEIGLVTQMEQDHDEKM